MTFAASRPAFAAPGPQPAFERRRAWQQHKVAMLQMITGKADWLPVLIFASIFMTPEARLDLGGFQLYPYRLALIVALPFMAVRVGRVPVRLRLADLLVVASGIWMLIATTMHYPLDVALKSGGAATLDSLAAYFVGRIYFRNALDFRKFLYRVSPLLLGVAVIMVMESVSHQYILRPFVGTITGHSSAAFLDRIWEIRNGLLRATGPFVHPIAAGLFFASLAPLYVASDLPRWRWFGLFACIGGIFGWSSAGIAAIIIGIGLGFYDHLQKKWRIGWAPVIAAVLIGCFLVQMLAEGGLLKFIIRYASLNPQTGYYRLAIWEYGSADVARHPWFGIGYFASFNRPSWMVSDSVDNYWLLLGLRFGWPSSLLMLAAVSLTVVALGGSRQGFEHGALHGHRMATGLCVSLVVVYISLLSSAPWGADMAWLTMLVGIANGMVDRALPHLDPPNPV